MFHLIHANFFFWINFVNRFMQIRSSLIPQSSAIPFSSIENLASLRSLLCTYSSHRFPYYSLGWSSQNCKNVTSAFGKFLLVRYEEGYAPICFLVSRLPTDEVWDLEVSRIISTASYSLYDLGRSVNGLHHGLATISGFHHYPRGRWAFYQRSSFWCPAHQLYNLQNRIVFPRHCVQTAWIPLQFSFRPWPHFYQQVLERIVLPQWDQITDEHVISSEDRRPNGVPE